MNIEEIKKLSDEELTLELKIATDEWFAEQADNLRAFLKKGAAGCPSDLCTSLDAVSEVEKIVTDRGLQNEYIEAFISLGYASRYLFRADLIKFATASARQRAEACLLALQTLSD